MTFCRTNFLLLLLLVLLLLMKGRSMLKNKIILSSLFAFTFLNLYGAASSSSSSSSSKPKEKYPQFCAFFHVDSIPYSDANTRDVILWRVVPFGGLSQDKGVEFIRISGSKKFIQHLCKVYEEYQYFEMGKFLKKVGQNFVQGVDDSTYLKRLDEVHQLEKSSWEDDLGSYYPEANDALATPKLAQEARDLIFSFPPEKIATEVVLNRCLSLIKKRLREVGHQGTFVVGGYGEARRFFKETKKVIPDDLGHTGWQIAHRKK